MPHSRLHGGPQGLDGSLKADRLLLVYETRRLIYSTSRYAAMPPLLTATSQTQNVFRLDVQRKSLKLQEWSAAVPP